MATKDDLFLHPAFQNAGLFNLLCDPIKMEHSILSRYYIRYTMSLYRWFRRRNSKDMSVGDVMKNMSLVMLGESFGISMTLFLLLHAVFGVDIPFAVIITAGIAWMGYPFYIMRKGNDKFTLMWNCMHEPKKGELRSKLLLSALIMTLPVICGLLLLYLDTK